MSGSRGNKLNKKFQLFAIPMTYIKSETRIPQDETEEDTDNSRSRTYIVVSNRKREKNTFKFIISIPGRLKSTRKPPDRENWLSKYV